MKRPSILAIPGSVRIGSSSHKLLDSIGSMISSEVDFTIYNGIGTLPHFDGSEVPPQAVKDFLEQLQQADGVLICTPEYAYGVPGTLKNALDWTVGNGEFHAKPVAYITAATGGERAHESLGYTLTAMASSIVSGGSLLISFIRSKIDAEGKVKDPDTAEKIKNVVDSLVHTISVTQS